MTDVQGTDDDPRDYHQLTSPSHEPSTPTSDASVVQAARPGREPAFWGTVESLSRLTNASSALASAVGRRLYETMAVWETNPALAKLSDRTADFASVWQAAAKVVYSTPD